MAAVEAGVDGGSPPPGRLIPLPFGMPHPDMCTACPPPLQSAIARCMPACSLNKELGRLRLQAGSGASPLGTGPCPSPGDPDTIPHGSHLHGQAHDQPHGFHVHGQPASSISAPCGSPPSPSSSWSEEDMVAGEGEGRSVSGLSAAPSLDQWGSTVLSSALRGEAGNAAASSLLLGGGVAAGPSEVQMRLAQLKQNLAAAR